MSTYTPEQLKALPHAVKVAATTAARQAQCYPKVKDHYVSPAEAFDAVVAEYLNSTKERE